MQHYKPFLFIFFLFLVALPNSFAQQPKKFNALEIYEALQKLNFFGNVMYVAAHPDDENTRLIGYFSKHYHAHTTYISLTRGDGGQNLIGAELGEKLGLIRTQELLEARKIDGGHQLFTRAIDFGYSKNPEEALAVWGEEEVLADLVFAVRKYRPDIVVNRFDHRTPGTTHGHHTASAQLAMRAFDLAGNPAAYPEQLEEVQVWQPKAIYFNDSWFFYESQEAFKNADHASHLAINIGSYYADVGLSNNEIAAYSRSMHKSQGFGNTGTRGDQMEYLELLKGSLPTANNIFQQVETSWKRMNHKNASSIQKLLQQVQADFDFLNPAASIPRLLKAYELLQPIENSFWKERKSQELADIIVACSGVFLEAKTKKSYATPSEEIEITIEATNQSDTALQLKSVSVLGNQVSSISPQLLENNQKNEWKSILKIPKKIEFSSPFWLKHPAKGALYSVEERSLRNLPERTITFPVEFVISIEGKELNIIKNLIYKYNDPVEGEVYENFSVLPPVSLHFEKDNLIVTDASSKNIDLKLKNYGTSQRVELLINQPKGWKIEPSNVVVEFDAAGQEKSIPLVITPAIDASNEELIIIARTSSGDFTQKVSFIDYPHIAKQSIVETNKVQLIRLDAKVKGRKVAYIEGAGDEVNTAIAELGYQVETFDVSSITRELLQDFDAVVVGIRAFNMQEELPLKKKILFDYAYQGGNVIVQYNTSRGLKTDISPWPLQLSRARVTDERSPVRFLATDHPVMLQPNAITQEDFSGWIQERGLYFAEQWAPEFTPVLGMNDANEPLQEGSLLIATYGKGYFTYTGLSFFRQLPAGVTGAYRLFANLLSLGND